MILRKERKQQNKKKSDFEVYFSKRLRELVDKVLLEAKG